MGKKTIGENVIRICKLCGNSFHPKTNRQMCCMETKSKICPICGKSFDYICTTSSPHNTCSKQCAQKYAAIRRKQEASKETRICKYCGKLFVPKSKRDIYCYNIHYKQCKVCGKLFEIDVRKDQTIQTCSDECRYKLMIQSTDYDKSQATLRKTIHDKYGVENTANIPGVREKAQQTCQERYGKSWYTQTDEYKERVKETSRDKYGVDHFLQSSQVIEKRKETCLETYGVDNVSKSVEIQNKMHEAFQSKYGVDNISQLNVGNLDEWKKFVQNPRSYILNTFDHKPTVTELSEYFQTCLTSIYNNLDVKANTDILDKSFSIMEEQVIAEIKRIDNSIKIERNNLTIIHPYEVDVYLPDYRLAIECDPTATHNSSVSDPWGGQAKAASYHMQKSKACNQEGITLLHIFGYDWKYRRGIINSILRVHTNNVANRIYARKCEIVNVDYKECKQFLDSNHLQGNVPSKVRLGLKYNDELISVMTFGSTRSTIGKKDDVSWELLRFCNKLDTSVVGGASKLFKYFVNQYEPQRIVSFSDVAHTSGKLYPILGFNYLRTSDPGYVWVDTKTDKAYHRMNAQKQNIKKFLKDDSIDLAQSESQIMIAHGFVKVYDCGNCVWEWLPDNC